MCCFFIKDQKNLDDLLSFIVNNGGRVVAAVASTGVSKKCGNRFFLMAITQMVLLFCNVPARSCRYILLNICRELELYKRGRGKAFIIDILGYMGAKGPFVE